MQKRKLRELKDQIRLAGGAVEDEDGKTPADIAREEAEAMAKDPMRGFPNDIRYFSREACEKKVGISEKYKGRMLKEGIWDLFRTEACLGKHGLVAKRCSMNDVLWRRYLKYGDMLSLGDIKKMILSDMKRRELYPPGYKGTGKEPPPVEYLEKLRSEGKLEQIYNDLETIGRI